MRILYSGKIVSEFNGFDDKAIFKMDDGSYWVQAEYKYWYCYSYMPDAMIIDDNGRTILSVANQSVLIRRIYDVTESQIEGEFNGCSGDTQYRFVNGQIWQQTDYKYKYKYAYRPKAIIIKDNGKYTMYVEGIQIPVTRIQ